MGGRSEGTGSGSSSDLPPLSERNRGWTSGERPEGALQREGQSSEEERVTEVRGQEDKSGVRPRQQKRQKLVTAGRSKARPQQECWWEDK